jgi:YHS domain-containing protein
LERRTRAGAEVFFCSAECALVFDRDPDRYPPPV